MILLGQVLVRVRRGQVVQFNLVPRLCLGTSCPEAPPRSVTVDPPTTSAEEQFANQVLAGSRRQSLRSLRSQAEPGNEVNRHAPPGRG
jgi:hypothetical protein